MESLRYFIAVAESQSLHKASDELNISQPALSKSIRHLEEEMGLSLFIRSPRGMVLTEAGQIMYDRALPIYEQWTNLRQDVRATIGTPPIKLGALPSLAAYYLPVRMTNPLPSVQLSRLAVYSTSVDGLSALLKGEIDALMSQAVTEHPSLWQRELFVEPYRVVSLTDHPLTRETAISLKDISRYPLVMHPPGCDVRSAVFLAFERENLCPDIAIEVPFNESIIGFVSAGMGIAIVPDLLADQATRLGLCVRPLEDKTLVRRIVVTARNAEVGRTLTRWLRPSPSSPLVTQPE